MRPKRIQRKRTKGWRMPERAIYVGRPTKWGNPFTIDMALELAFAPDEEKARALVVECFRDWVIKGDLSEWWFLNGATQHAWIRSRLSDLDLDDHDLACWCPLDQPCHADVLLELANR